jgi:D-aminopeptidase
VVGWSDRRIFVPARNLITDVPGVLVGHAQDDRLGSGVTAVVFEEPAVASIDVRGGGPGTRETDMLEPAATVDRIDAIALSGGSAFGLEAGGGVQAWLRERGRGFAVRTARVPIVPGAILFDLLAGGDKDWGRFAPYRDFGFAAAENAAVAFALGSVGAGLGATTLDLKGGIGSAAAVTPAGLAVGALAAVNAPPDALVHRTKGGQRESTTLVVVATDAALTKGQARRLAVMAQTGLARSIYPVHTPLDGDVVFAAATGRKPLGDPLGGLSELGTSAANVVARAVARAVFAAAPLPFGTAPASWRDRFAAQFSK